METSRGEFKGTKRFRILRRIGTGGMGEVYEAFDRAHQTRVALKLLTVRKPDALLRFKNEFRALHEIEHPNLVSFGEMVEESGSWFFTMEFVDGVDFYQYVRPGDETDSMPTRQLLLHRRTEAEAEAGARRGRQGGGFDESRLRHGLGQLVSAVAALHAAGKIHRDIKPSNVRVDRDGRVVLLDFGLVADIDRVSYLTGVEELVGTPAFAAPEQAGMREVGPEADWYSVGVVLYLALTRRLPFDGTAMEILMHKQQGEPPPPSALVPGLPVDLDALCVDLLRRDPDARLGDVEVLRRLGIEGSVVSRLPGGSSPGPVAPFVGRGVELDMLTRLVDDTRDDRAITVTLHGESGVGKTSLLRQLGESVAASRGAVVLTARCYENELVPFKAVDGLIDALIQYLRGLPRKDVAALLPSKVALLTQVFPALRGVEAIAEAPASLDTVRDPQELRGRAFGAVRELLARLAERHPLVLILDDMQWTDADSLALLREIMRVPEPPALLLVLVVRDGPGTEAPVMSAAMPGTVVRIDLPRLPPDEARELATRILDQVEAGDDEVAAAIAAEADGHPLFIDELARHAPVVGHRTEQLVLDEVLWSRIESLGAEARQILEIAAVAGEPLPRTLAASALGMDFGELARRASLLRLAHLLRQSDTGHHDSIEPYHDRVRAAVTSRLPVERRRDLHRRLALAIEASRSGDDDALVRHWRDAGDPAKALRYALRAGTQAEAILAFERAAQLYRLALELGITDETQASRTRVLLGDALRNAGRGRDAAGAYLDAAAGSASAAERLELMRRAGEELLLSGHFDAGMAALESVLTSIGTRFPATPRRALLSLVWNRIRLRVRGLRFRERDASQVSAEALSRADVSSAIAAGLSIIDNVRGADFQSRNLLAALHNGEPRRIARALAIEAGHAAIGATRSEKRTRHLLDASARLAARLGDPYALALQPVVTSMTHLLAGRWREGLRLCDEADATLRATCAGVAWEMDSTQMFAVDCMWFLGQLRELSRRLPLRIAEAEARGDLYASINFRTGAPALLWLADDRPDEARTQVADAMASWSRRGVHVQHYRELFALVHLDLYQGRGDDAHRRVLEAYPIFERAQLLRVDLIRSIMTDLRARTELAAPAPDARRLRSVLRAASRLASGTMPWGPASAALLRAGVAALRGDKRRAIEQLRIAIPAFETSDMPLYAAAARWRQGELVGGVEGSRLTGEAETRLRAEGVTRPERFVAMLATGFGDP